MLTPSPAGEGLAPSFRVLPHGERWVGEVLYYRNGVRRVWWRSRPYKTRGQAMRAAQQVSAVQQARAN